MAKPNGPKPDKKRSRPEFTRLPVDSPALLLQFLLDQLTDQGRNNIKSLLKHHQVAVGGQVVTRHDHPLRPGDEVLVNWNLIRYAARNRGAEMEIVYADDDIIVVDKPAGLLSIATETEKDLTAYRQLTDYVRRDDPTHRIFIVHRLDRDTSGLMLFARNEAAKHRLQGEWKEMVKERAYVALVEGSLEEKNGTLRSWLLTAKTGLMYSGSAPGDGQEAVTHYRVLQKGANYSLLDIRLDTGRKNQIRVQLKELGHPIAGDRKYGAATNPLGRLALHAYLLSFYHPATDQLMRFETEIPKSFVRLSK